MNMNYSFDGLTKCAYIEICLMQRGWNLDGGGGVWGRRRGLENVGGAWAVDKQQKYDDVTSKDS